MASALVAAPALASSGPPASAAAQGAYHTANTRAGGTTVQLAGTAALDSFSSSAGKDATATARTYIVRGGDTLSAIAQRFYHDAADWQWVYHENAKTVANPNVIYVGERLSVPLNAPADYTLPYQPRHAKPVTTMVATSTGANSRGTSYNGRIGLTDWESSDSRTHPAAIHHPAPSSGTTTDNSSSSSSKGWVPPPGNYSCSDLEQLWDAAGGNPGSAFMAAEIAMAESGGNPNAISPTDDYGLWQINASNGALATLDPFKNAKSAIILSGDGHDWDPWTTYTSGAYSGRC
jgi:LysM repeat protein